MEAVQDLGMFFIVLWAVLRFKKKAWQEVL